MKQDFKKNAVNILFCFLVDFVVVVVAAAAAAAVAVLAASTTDVCL